MNSDDVGKRMMKLEVPGKRPGGRPKRRLMDVTKEEVDASLS